MPLKHSLLFTVYLYGSGWMWSRTHSLCSTSIRAASRTPVCLWWHKPSWIRARRQSTAWAKTPPLTSCCMPRTFPATRTGWRGEQEQFCLHNSLPDLLNWLKIQTKTVNHSIWWTTAALEIHIRKSRFPYSFGLHVSKVLVWRDRVETWRNC